MVTEEMNDAQLFTKFCTSKLLRNLRLVQHFVSKISSPDCHTATVIRAVDISAAVTKSNNRLCGLFGGGSTQAVKNEQID